MSYDDLLSNKLQDAEIPGAVVTFDPTEADEAGAFEEDALDFDQAYQSQFDRDE